jgi:peptidoglycan hydrolase-like protein with peptidoglycan-binding domain
MNKFIVTEEEKNRIIGLHRKLIMEQTQSEVEGQVSLDFFEKNEIYKMSSETTDGGSGTSGTSGGSGTSGTSGGFQETTLTVEDLKSGQTVSMGKKGPIVKQIQELLIGKGYKEVSKSGEPDSMFGSMTKAQVEKFQSENTNDKGEPLQKDGIVGPETINALLKVPTPYTKGVETAVKQVLPTGVSPTLSPPDK